jgi:DNA modification methylase
MNHGSSSVPPTALPSVLATGQQPSRLQRHGRYTPESMCHPGKMLPVIAATVIKTFTDPGDLVVDPMCGIGTTLVEAIHLGRDAAGVEYEPDFVHLALDNLRHARSQGASGMSQLACGDACNIATIYRALHRQAALVLTSPPYGSRTHGHIRSGRDNGGGRSSSGTTATPPIAATWPTRTCPAFSQASGRSWPAVPPCCDAAEESR